MDQRYSTGEEIHIGDRVTYHDCPATIMLVIDREEWPVGETEENSEWWRSEHKSGFLLAENAGARVFVPDVAEHLSFISRGQPPATI